jgi:intracellular multiplication protein IcmP
MTPRPQPRASWPSSDDTTGFNLIVILLGCGVGGYLLWTNYHEAICAAVMSLAHQEILLLGHFTDRFQLADRQMAAADSAGVTLRDLYGIGHAIGLFVRIPATAFIVLLAAICAVRAAPSRFKRAFDLDGLMREQASSFRTSTAFVRRHLRLVAPASEEPRPADFALTPEEWMARFARRRDGSFDSAAAHDTLRHQLGPRWTEPEAAEPVVRCLFTAFALHLAERRDDALQLLGTIAAGLRDRGEDKPEGPDQPIAPDSSVVAKADAILSEMNAKDARGVASGHGYTTPAMMELLVRARRRAGVLAPAQFAWLKLVDRRLWYALHSLGYETDGFGHYLHPNPRVEAMGARDHWAAERAVGGPVIEPSLGQALEALRKSAGSKPCV